MKKIPVLICDSAFSHAKSSSGDNIPKHITWVRDFDKNNENNDLVFFTDQNIFNFFNVKSKIKICWILEPVSIFPQSYDFIRFHYSRPDFFDYILTYDRELIELNKNLDKEKFIFVPHCGSWIKEDDFKIYDKSKTVSMIASNKSQTSGHRKRHAVLKYFGQRIDVMGGITKSIKSKKEGLCDYRYSVVIENIKQNDYFTEKLIDCLSVSCVALYWGTENIGKYFNEKSIIQFDTISELGYILDNICSEEDYNSRIDAIKKNLEECKKYRVAEDYIYENILVKKGLI